MPLLRIKMKGRETVFEYTVNKRDFKETVAGHMNMWGRETVSVGTDKLGNPIMVQRDVPKDIWEFFWVSDPGEDNESVEPVTLG